MIVSPGVRACVCVRVCVCVCVCGVRVARPRVGQITAKMRLNDESCVVLQLSNVRRVD